MLKLKLAPQAVKDLEEIYEYTLLNWGITQTEKYQDELYSAMQTVLENPSIGSLYFFKEGNYRKMNINRHIIFYRQNQEEIIVIRIFHERMDLESKLRFK